MHPEILGSLDHQDVGIIIGIDALDGTIHLFFKQFYYDVNYV